MNFRKLLEGVAVCAALALPTATDASAAVIVFTANGTGPDGAESASATITTAPNALTVSLSSLIANSVSSGQTVSGVEIFLGQSPTAATLTNSSGSLIAFTDKNGNTAPDTTDVINHWGTALAGNELFLATVGTGAAGGQPDDLIIGNGPYSGGNASLFEHSPFIKGTGTFSISLQGDAFPTIDNVVFLFGTQPTSLVGVDAPVPEPSVWALMVLGFGAIGFAMRSRHKTIPVA